MGLFGFFGRFVYKQVPFLSPFSFFPDAPFSGSNDTQRLPLFIPSRKWHIIPKTVCLMVKAEVETCRRVHERSPSGPPSKKSAFSTPQIVGLPAEKPAWKVL